jgi:hypothetical protein
MINELKNKTAGIRRPSVLQGDYYARPGIRHNGRRRGFVGLALGILVDLKQFSNL